MAVGTAYMTDYLNVLDFIHDLTMQLPKNLSIINQMQFLARDNR